MAKWYETNEKNPEYSRCKRCKSLFNTKDAEKFKECQYKRCGYNGAVDDDTQESLKRIHGK